MGTKRILPIYKILSDQAINKISDASFDILENTGVKVPNKRVWDNLKEFGANVDENNSIIRIPYEITRKAIELAGKKHILWKE